MRTLGGKTEFGSLYYRGYGGEVDRLHSIDHAWSVRIQKVKIPDEIVNVYQRRRRHEFSLASLINCAIMSPPII